MPKTSSIRSTVSIEHRLVTDTDGHVTTARVIHGLGWVGRIRSIFFQFLVDWVGSSPL